MTNTEIEALGLPPFLLTVFGWQQERTQVVAWGKGLIHRTWKVDCENESFILQRINEAVFRNPQAIDFNLSLTGSWLAEHHPSYRFVGPLTVYGGRTMVELAGSFFRVFPFIAGTHA